MGLYMPPSIARAGPHFKTLAWVVVWLCILYIAITSIISSWWGAVVWITYLVWVVWFVRRGYNELRRKKTFDDHLRAEQLEVILDLRRVVEDVDAHTIPKRAWTVYFTRRYWRPTELPPKPSLEEIESVLKESEDAVGPYDVNILAALRKLLVASRAPRDMDLERKVLERFVPFTEHTKGRDHEILIPLLARVGQLHFVQANYTRSASELRRALDLHHQHEHTSPQSRNLLSKNTSTFCRKMLAMAYTMAHDSASAEPLCMALLSQLEQEEGVLNTEPLSTQFFRGMLIGVYIRQGWTALYDPTLSDPRSVCSRYLRDALRLVVVHPSFYAHNLKQVGRLFVWAGRADDRDAAFRLANAVYDAGSRGGTAQRNCLCSPSNQLEKHGLRQCDACSKNIGLGDAWYFCRSCVDTDLCGECYAGFEGRGEEDGWQDVEKFPRECLGHEFYRVREDEREEGVSVQGWVGEMVRRLNAELGDGGRGSEVSA